LKNCAPFRIFEQLALALKNRVYPDIVLNNHFAFRIFEQLALALWNRVCPEFTVLDIYFSSYRIFEQLALALKNRVCPDIFHCIEIFFIIQDFWATCACPENRVCPENLQVGVAAAPPVPPPRTRMVTDKHCVMAWYLVASQSFTAKRMQNVNAF